MSFKRLSNVNILMCRNEISGAVKEMETLKIEVHF